MVKVPLWYAPGYSSCWLNCGRKLVSFADTLKINLQDDNEKKSKENYVTVSTIRYSQVLFL
jgi:hypothetical protein